MKFLLFIYKGGSSKSCRMISLNEHYFKRPDFNCTLHFHFAWQVGRLSCFTFSLSLCSSIGVCLDSEQISVTLFLKYSGSIAKKKKYCKKWNHYSTVFFFSLSKLNLKPWFFFLELQTIARSSQNTLSESNHRRVEIIQPSPIGGTC